MSKAGRNYRAALAARAEEIAETKARLLLNIKPLLDGLRQTKTLAVNDHQGKATVPRLGVEEL